MSESYSLPDIGSHLARLLRCQSCRRRARPKDLQTLQHQANSAVFRLRCPVCAQERLLVARWSGLAVKMYHTELDAEEWQHYSQSPRVSADDVIRMHLTMSTYDGDLSDVLEDPLPPYSCDG